MTFEVLSTGSDFLAGYAECGRQVNARLQEAALTAINGPFIG